MKYIPKHVTDAAICKEIMDILYINMTWFCQFNIIFSGYQNLINTPFILYCKLFHLNILEQTDKRNKILYKIKRAST